MNIYEFAMKMELDGKAYYEKLSAETGVTVLKAVFDDLARDEQKHHNVIKSLAAGHLSAMTDSDVLEKAKNIFNSLPTDKDVTGGLRNALDGYRHARKIEADSVSFYEGLAEKEKKTEVRQLIQKIIAEEKKHYNIMDNLCEYALAPQNYLAWGEFSNLKEL